MASIKTQAAKNPKGVRKKKAAKAQDEDLNN
jgi:hypothetical protein